MDLASKPPKVLGVTPGDGVQADKDLLNVIEKTDALRRAVAEASDPATELTLNRVCLGLGKANYLLRCQGDRISQDVPACFDRGMCAGVENSLWGPLSDTAWRQAALSVDATGLGMREASGIALAAFVASRVVARLLVGEMARHCEAAGIATAASVMLAYDERTEEAWEQWIQDEVPDACITIVRQHKMDAAEAAERRWGAWCLGEEAEPHQPPDAPGTSDFRPSSMVIRAVGPEWPGQASHGSSPHLQRLFTAEVDRNRAQGLVDLFASQGEQGAEDVKRLRDLMDEDQSHYWL